MINIFVWRYDEDEEKVIYTKMKNGNHSFTHIYVFKKERYKFWYNFTRD